MKFYYQIADAYAKLDPYEYNRRNRIQIEIRLII